eukprot:scaffold53328_cov74-Phaeocystis_antarctica.AAC.2
MATCPDVGRSDSYTYHPCACSHVHSAPDAGAVCGARRAARDGRCTTARAAEPARHPSLRAAEPAAAHAALAARGGALARLLRDGAPRHHLHRLRRDAHLRRAARRAPPAAAVGAALGPAPHATRLRGRRRTGAGGAHRRVLACGRHPPQLRHGGDAPSDDRGERER